MFTNHKRLLYPIHITKKDPHFAKIVVTQFGGPYGELGAALRYLMQRYTMPDERGRTLLTDIAVEEFGHVEMINTIVAQLVEGVPLEELKKAGFSANYAEHGYGQFPTDAQGVPFSVAGIGSTGDYQADLAEDMAAEEKARLTYEHLIDLTDNPEVKNVLLYLRQREVVHYNRFKDMLETYNKEFKK